MAQVFGVSQAWRSVVNKLGSDGAGVKGPACVGRLVAALELAQSSWPQQAEAQYRQKIQGIGQQIDACEREIGCRRRVADAEIGPQIRHYQSMLEDYQTRGNWFVRLYHRFTTVPRINSKLTNARHAFATTAREIVRDRDRLIAELSWLMGNGPQLIATAIQQQAQRLDNLKHVLQCPEMAGASAELEMAALLADLPESFTVLHDVNLAHERGIRFDGNWLKTAQCDHVVVGPTGIFVIESKRWSREFAAMPDRFDPVEQVGRARLLCQCLLRDNGYQVTPHDIIANAGTRVAKPTASRCRICVPQVVTAHILGSSGRLEADQIAGIVQVLRQYMT